MRPICAALALGVSCLVWGCALPVFVYSPNPPLRGVERLPYGAVVLPFDDATEDFKFRKTAPGFFFPKGVYNLAKYDGQNGVPRFYPEALTKTLHDELSHSGLFNPTS